MATKRDTGIHVENANLLLRTLNKMGDNVSNDLRDSSTILAESFLGDLVPAAKPGQQSAAAAAFKVYRDRVPKVGFPGRKATGVSGGARAGELFYGAEFGSGDFRFGPSKRDGNFFYPTLRSEGEGYALEWFDDITRTMETNWDKAAARAAAS